MKKLLLSISIAALVSTSALSFAKSNDDMNEHPPRLMKELNLSDQQKADIKQIRDEAKQDASIYKTEVKAFRQSMRALLESGEWDEQQVRNLIEGNENAAKQLKLINAQSKNRVYNALSADQKSLMLQKRAEKQAERGVNNDQEGKKPRKQKRKGKTGLAGLKLEKLSKRLDLSEEQQSQVAALIDQAKAQRELDKEDRQANRNTLKSIIQAPEFDESAWTTFYDNTSEGHVERALAKTKLRFDLLSVLNVEQKQKFKAMMKKKMKNKKRKSRAS
jgi:protein CpxP